jgi:FkbM family methyltransferase
MATASSFSRGLDSAKQSLRSRLAQHPALMRAAKASITFARRVLGTPHERDFRLLGQLALGLEEVILDIGANHGQSIRSIRLFQRNAPIVAFEPNPILALLLAEHFASDRSVRIVNEGLAARAGELALRIPVYGKTTYDGLASFGAGAEIADQFTDFDASKLSYRQHLCVVKTLDSHALQPGFIKIDVEGFEAEVLEGGMGTLRQYLPVMLIEDGSRGVIRELLEPLGYRAYRYESGGLVAEVAAARNTLFIHPTAARGLLSGQAV